MTLCEHCWIKPAKHNIEVLRRKFIEICVRCYREATGFEVLSMDAMRALPDDQDWRGVYFLWAGNELQYIGQSMQIGNRVTQHERAYTSCSSHSKQIKFDKVTSLIIDRRSFAHVNEIRAMRNRFLIIERAYIERYRPPFNTEWFL